MIDYLRTIKWNAQIIRHARPGPWRVVKSHMRLAWWEGTRHLRSEYVCRIPPGVDVELAPNSVLARIAFSTGGYIEPREQAFTEHYLRQGDTALDVGANVGMYSVAMGAIVRPGRVLAFEPHPAVFKLLEANVARNNLQNVETICSAVGEDLGTLQLTTGFDEGNYVVDSALKDTAGVVSVPCVTLDSVARGLSDISLVKLDTEGFEYRVLMGARELLSRPINAPVWICELIGGGNRYGNSDDQVLSRFAEFGYKPYEYDQDARFLHPISSRRRRFNGLNAIFIRDLSSVYERIGTKKDSPPNGT